VTYFFETYGCQMNSAESAALDMVIRERGWRAAADGESADLVLLNTCSVRATAEQRVMGRLARYAALKKKRPFTLIVAGCMAQRLGEGLKDRVKGVDFVMGTSARSVFPLILEALEKGVPAAVSAISGEKPRFAFSSSHLEGGQFRCFVPIMHGCNNFCSYCIVPYVRGREISRSPGSILKEIDLLASRGVREITLLGQNVNSYKWEGDGQGAAVEPDDADGKADGSAHMPSALDFPGLLELIAGEVEKTPIRWIRFLSANPKDLSSRAIRVMTEHPVFCRHLHLCVQHGSNRILAAMNRRYTREQYLDLVAEVREALPGITLSTDILIGFPGETDRDVEETLDLMEQVRFLYAYMYHYNPREGTAAYDLSGRIPEDVKRSRLNRVIELQKGVTRDLLRRRIGSAERILVEGISRKNADELIGRTERDEMAVAPGDPALIGSFATVTFSSLRGNTFRAKELCICPGD
jgi:tRNA-2-methylthio-N6-dimethylallyladenosine synthase